MKKLIGFIIAISSLSASAQSLEDKYLEPIIIELIEKDGCTYTLNKKDSIITVLKETNEKQKEVIKQYKLNEEEYKKVIKNNEEITKIDALREKAYEKQIQKLERREKLIIIASVIIIIILL